MSFGKRLRDRRKELGYSQGELAEKLGVSLSAVSNYENGLNAMREDVLLRLFRVLDVEPNYLYQDDFSGRSFTCSVEEERLVKAYRTLRLPGKQTLRAMADALTAYQADLDADRPEEEIRQIPLYRNPAAAGYASPVFGEDFDYIDVTGDTPRGAEFAVRIHRLCEPGPPDQRGRGDLLRGRGNAVQAVCPGPPGDRVPVLPEPGQGGRGRGAAPGQRADHGVLRPGAAERASEDAGRAVGRKKSYPKAGVCDRMQQDATC